MKSKIVFLVVFMLLSSFSAIRADEFFDLYSSDPVVTHGKTEEWDGKFTDPGAVVYHDGKFHMFRNGFKSWPGSVQVGYLTSEDGLTWTEVSPDPVMETKSVPYAGIAALASSVLVEDDGTWVMYFYTWETYSGGYSPASIGRATAPDPAGPWTADPEAILTPGSEDSWDGLNVNSPRVLKTADGYMMYYGGFGKNGLTSSKIGMATSPDGITWTKYDDTATKDAPFADSDPILQAVEKGSFAHQPMVHQTDQGWVMVYRQAKPRAPMSLYLATSKDGIQWTPASGEAVWTGKSIPNSNGFWFTAMVHHEDTYYLYIEAGRGVGTDIYAATFKGDFSVE